MTTTDATESAASALQVMLIEYQELREDKRLYTYALATVASVIVAIVSAVFFLYSKDEELFKPDSPIFLLAPMLPAGGFAYLVYLGMHATIRSYYVRLVERRIHQLLPPESVTDSADGARLLVPITESLLHTVMSQRTGAARDRAIGSLIYITLLGAVYATFILAVRSQAFSTTRTVAAWLMYVPLGAFLLFALWSVTLGGPHLWRTALQKVEHDLADPIGHAGGMRAARDQSLLTYVLVPRRRDLALRRPLGFIGFLSAALISGPRDADWLSYVFFFAVIDVLAYQVRYMVNDYRDRDFDVNHPRRSVRNRLPLHMFRGPPEADALQRGILIAAGVLRLGAAMGLVAIAPEEARAWLFGGFVAVGLLTAAYEAGKKLSRGTAPAVRRLAGIAVLLAGGAGYGARSATAFALGSHGDAPVSTWVIAAVVTLNGIVALSLVWVAELADLKQTGLGHEDEKPHLHTFDRWLRPGTVWHYSTRPSSPWNIALVLGAASSGVVWTYELDELVSVPRAGDTAWLASAVVVVAALAMTVWRSRAWLGAIVIGSAALAMCVLELDADAGQAFGMVLVWLAIATTYGVMVDRTYMEMQTSARLAVVGRRISKQITAIWHELVRRA